MTTSDCDCTIAFVERVHVNCDGTLMHGGIKYQVRGRHGRHVRGRQFFMVPDAWPRVLLLFAHRPPGVLRWDQWRGSAYDEAGIAVDAITAKLTGFADLPLLPAHCASTRKEVA